MIRTSRINLMCTIVSLGARGYYKRGDANFEWLRKQGLAELVDPAMLKHRLTAKGILMLRAMGICVRCGGAGAYRTNDYAKPWATCDHVEKEKVT